MAVRLAHGMQGAHTEGGPTLSEPWGHAVTVLPTVGSPEAARAGVHAMLNLRTCWCLTWSQLARLLGRAESTPRRWTSRAPASLSPDVLDRMGYLIAIFYTLEQIRGGHRSTHWLRAPNAGNPFFGRSPLDYMLRGRIVDLVETHRYLKGVATGTYQPRVRS